MIAIIIVLIIVAAVMLFVILNQRKRIAMITEQAQQEINTVQQNAEEKVRAANQACEKEKAELNDRHAEEIQSILQNCELENRQAREHAKEEIESRRSVLSQMADKEMLINVMIALDGYGTRLDRIEKYFIENKIIEHTNRMFQSTTDKIDAVTKSLAGQLDEMHDSLENAFNESDFKNKIEYICAYMRELDSDTNEKITEQTAARFQDLEDKVDEMTKRLAYQIGGMNGTIEESLRGSDFKNRVEDVRKDLSDLAYDVNEIKSSVCDGCGTSIAEEINDIKSNVDSIKDSVDEVHSSVCDTYSYDSLASKIEDIKDAVGGTRDALYDIKSDVAPVRYDVDSIKDSVDKIQSSVCDTYSYDSLASKMEEIRDAVRDTKDMVESRLG